MSVLGVVVLFLCFAILNAREQQEIREPIKRDFIGRKRG